jgi:hypothetical protein
LLKKIKEACNKKERISASVTKKICKTKKIRNSLSVEQDDHSVYI